MAIRSVCILLVLLNVIVLICLMAVRRNNKPALIEVLALLGTCLRLLFDLVLLRQVVLDKIARLDLDLFLAGCLLVLLIQTLFLRLHLAHVQHGHF